MNKVKVSLWPLCVCMVLLFSSFSFANENVRLIHSQFTPYFDNGFDFAELEGAIEVKNIGYNKAVWLHYEATDGTWKDHPAYWVGPSNDGYEVFTFRLPLEGPVGNVQFAVKYEVNGQSYWDNNDSQNYQFDSHQQTYFNQQFIALDDVSRSSYSVSLTARARHLNANDRVVIVYSLDGWASNYERELQLSHLVGNTEGESGVWQTELGVEYYRGMEFYLRLESDVGTSYDSYFGKNYFLGPNSSIGTGNKLRRYPHMLLRMKQNQWSNIPMQLVDDYTWQATLYFEFLDFKFDAYGDWSRNFGDNNTDGFIDLNGKNIRTQRGGTHTILFNTLSEEYSITPL